jgi:hypothetical protein
MALHTLVMVIGHHQSVPATSTDARDAKVWAHLNSAHSCPAQGPHSGWTGRDHGVCLLLSVVLCL